jgi:hypothetical protein
MAQFDQRHQTVIYQYNADAVNFNAVSNRTEFVQQIDNMTAEISRASTSNAIDKTHAEKAQKALREASAEAQKPYPDRSKLTSALETAGNLVKGATALGGLYMAVTKAIEVAHLLF